MPTRVWRSLDEVEQRGPRVVTVGNFDGAHRGHQIVIARARSIAAQRGVPLAAVTFDPHPMAVLRPDHAPSVLTPIDQRAELLGSLGVDEVLVLPFDRDVARWSPEQFVDRVLVDALGVEAVVVGANFRFGARAAGDVGLLGRLGVDRGFVAEGVELDGGPQVWSSTYVRTCLAAGDVAGAAEALGRPFAVRGPVVEGDRRGRELGYPTANVALAPDAAAPADGVYAGWLSVRDTDDPAPEPWPTAISVGTNPTFAGDRARRVEAYVLDRTDLALYGHVVEVSFTHHLRGMVAFGSVDLLLEQMVDDVAAARAALLDGWA